ncbi:MAG: DciA family protein [Methylotenera sp.]|nr:DciA family protein [Methylotenera sp.]MDO9232459.1 DciA family protein [Methylotenera sp.]MDO9389895.1 DciA family protein [Methylotenera sp.]MDP2101521.1 DciA family protein [Methylotenera sp.]MDP2281909.1 DciA family protein [Methylotenera sp.]
MQRFNTLLRQPELIALNARNLQTQTAQKIWEAIAPDNLAKLSHVSSIENKRFTVFANNNAVAAKIKLLIPSLLIKLEKQEYEVTAIRVKVQVKSNPKPKLKSLKKLSPIAATHLQQLGQSLSGTALGDALIKLAKNAD